MYSSKIGITVLTDNYSDYLNLLLLLISSSPFLSDSVHFDFDSDTAFTTNSYISLSPYPSLFFHFHYHVFHFSNFFYPINDSCFFIILLNLTSKGPWLKLNPALRISKPTNDPSIFPRSLSVPISPVPTSPFLMTIIPPPHPPFITI